ncbi:MAG: caspase family protein [Pirellulales bacterium]
MTPSGRLGRMLFLFGCVASAALFAGSSAHAQKIHAIVVADMSPAARWGNFAPNLEKDCNRVDYLLMENVPFDDLVSYPVYMPTDELSHPDEVVRAIEELKPEANDSILFYYTGHGGLDDRGAFFDLAGGDLYRSEVLGLLKAKGARLVVMLTDCCAARNDRQIQTFPRNPAPDVPETYTPLFKSLFVDARGVVDVNSCGPSESAFFLPKNEDGHQGSIFTATLDHWMRKHRNRPTTWDELLGDVALQTHVAFRENYPNGVAFSAKGNVVQRQQNVYAKDYPGKPLEKGPRAGIAVRDDASGTPRIVEIVPGSPAEKAYDLVGERYLAVSNGARIVSMNGRAIKSAEEFTAAMQESPQILRLTIDAGRGSRELLVRLRY